MNKVENNIIKEKNENEAIADLLETYAQMIRRPNYEISIKQKQLMKELGHTFMISNANVPRRVLHRKIVSSFRKQNIDR